MGDPPGQLSDRLHLLRLHQSLLRPLALRDFLHQEVVRESQFPCAIRNTAFESLVQMPKLVLGQLQFEQMAAGSVLSIPGPERRRDGATQGLAVDGPFQHDKIAQLLEQGLSLLRTPSGPLGRQQDEREVRPGGLIGKPVDHSARVGFGQGFLSGERCARASGHLSGQFLAAQADAMLSALLGQELRNDLGVAAAQGQQENACFHDQASSRPDAAVIRTVPPR